MRALILALILTALTGCSDPAADAERELAIIEKTHASNDELCKAKRKVADAYLKAQDSYKYEQAKVSANLACFDAQYPQYAPGSTRAENVSGLAEDLSVQVNGAADVETSRREVEEITARDRADNDRDAADVKDGSLSDAGELTVGNENEVDGQQVTQKGDYWVNSEGKVMAPRGD